MKVKSWEPLKRLEDTQCNLCWRLEHLTRMLKKSLIWDLRIHFVQFKQLHYGAKLIFPFVQVSKSCQRWNLSGPKGQGYDPTFISSILL